MLPKHNQIAFYFLILLVLWVKKERKEACATSSFSVTGKNEEEAQEKSCPWETPGYYYFLIRQKNDFMKPFAKMRSPLFAGRHGTRSLSQTGDPPHFSPPLGPPWGFWHLGARRSCVSAVPIAVLVGINVTSALFLGEPFPALSILTGRWGGVKYLRDTGYLLRI